MCFRCSFISSVFSHLVLISFFYVFFFFSSRRRHTRCGRDGVQTCALPISSGCITESAKQNPQRKQGPRVVPHTPQPTRAGDTPTFDKQGPQDAAESAMSPLQSKTAIHWLDRKSVV